MTTHRRVVRAVERGDLLQRVGGLVCGLSIAVFALGILTLGLPGPTNPKATTSVYAALQGDGYMQWLFLPMIAISLAMLVAGLLMLAMARRRSR